jgi:hypothetical protein
MQGGTNPLEGAMGAGACGQIYRLARPSGNSQILGSLRIMVLPASDPSDDVTVYLVEESQRRRAYLETDAAAADREMIVRSFEPVR